LPDMPLIYTFSQIFITARGFSRRTPSSTSLGLVLRQSEKNHNHFLRRRKSARKQKTKLERILRRPKLKIV
jgi:hypothetical protein